jgi:EAL domain-containing protein (putative c-di-GMP-specific phosphodiesterase class I)
MNIDAKEHLSLISDMRKGIPNGEFVLYFQPKIDLRSNKVTGAEALIRWQHPQRGLIIPDQFIHLAERSGLIVELGEWVIREACRACRQWHDLGFTQLSVGINVSSIQFKRGNIKQVIVDSLDSEQLSPKHLEIELTESTLMDLSTSLKDSMDEIRNVGIDFSIDDFGTGYSNLGYLKQFDVQTLKIDRSFIADILTDVHDEAIVNAIIQISSSLDITTVAEGIEDQETASRLSQLHCDIGQGYFWSRPLPQDEFIEFMEHPPEKLTSLS